MRTAAVHVETRRINLPGSFIMSFAITSAKSFGIDPPPPPETHDEQVGNQTVQAGLLSNVAK
jgi:hypothetical protein